MSKIKILVTGATGVAGSALVAQLKSLNVPFVVAVRDIEKAIKKFGLKHDQVVRFDFSDPTTFNSAIEGIDRVFLLGPSLVMDMDKLVVPFIEFLKNNGIMRIVYFSALIAEEMGPELTFHTKIEEKLKADGFVYTILKPSFFSQNFKTYEWDNINKYNITYVPAGSGKVSFVDVNDIASVAAAALTEGGHDYKTYLITGPEALSYENAAQQLSEITGKTIVYPNPTPGQYTETLKNAGVPDFVAPYMVAVYSTIARDGASQITNDVFTVTGKKATSLKEVLKRDFSI